MDKQASSGGIGFLGILGLLFIALKLTGHISWSWWFVLLPLYGIPAIFIAIALFALLMACLTGQMSKRGAIR